MRQIALGFALCFANLAAAAPVLDVGSTTDRRRDDGTLHYVDELRVGMRNAEPLKLTTDIGAGVLRPTPDQQFPVGDSDVVLLGWSSFGGGMVTLHAMLFHIDGDRVALRGELTLTGDRRNTALRVRRGDGDRLLLGVAEPPAVVHEPADWSLSAHPQRDESSTLESVSSPLGALATEPLTLDAIRKLHYVDAQPRETDTVFTPPWRSGEQPARVAWISATPQGFAPFAGPY